MPPNPVPQSAGRASDSKLGLPNSQVCLRTLLELVDHDPKIVVVCSDTSASSLLAKFRQRFPLRYFDVGIAEQNLIGVAAGLALSGCTVVALSYAGFMTSRAIEFIQQDVDAPRLPVLMIGTGTGLSYGPMGATHHCLHDISFMRHAPNVSLLSPCDNAETAALIRQAMACHLPAYIRLGRRAVPDLTRDPSSVCLGRFHTICNGRDLVYLATGEIVAMAYNAATRLRDIGIDAGVYSVHTLVPFDRDALVSLATSAKALVVVEEHLAAGGLGEMVCSLLVEQVRNLRVQCISVGRPSVIGAQDYLLEHGGISAEILTNVGFRIMQ